MTVPAAGAAALPQALPPLASELAADVRAGFTRRPRQLPPKYLYDDLGTALFEAICELPWYRVTRAEMSLISRHAHAIAARFGVAPFIVELGPGSGAKLLRLADAFAMRPTRPHLHLIDISSSALAAAQQALARLAGFTVTVDRTTYEDGMRHVEHLRPTAAPMLTLLLGSNIGNFEADQAEAFLRHVREAGRDGDWLLLGADLVKPARDLELAYDDPLGVTAAFNKNLLLRLNRELGAEFDLDAFEHRAIWNAEHSRVEMHLVCRRAHSVRIPAAGLVDRFEAGDMIWTESSCKYTPAGLTTLASAAGFALRSTWIDEKAGFALMLFEAGEPAS